MPLTIDRFESGFAVCEDDSGDTLTLSPDSLPEGAKEGDILTKDESGEYSVDAEATRRKREAMKSRLSALFARSGENS